MYLKNDTKMYLTLINKKGMYFRKGTANYLRKEKNEIQKDDRNKFQKEEKKIPQIWEWNVISEGGQE